VKVCRGNYGDMKVDGKFIRHFDNVFFASVAPIDKNKTLFDYLNHEDPLVWHKNTFATMLHLIIKMGAKTIYLVGCDMGGKDYYDNRELSEKERACNHKLYSEQVKWLKGIAKIAKSKGITIFSTTPESPINEFFPFKDVIDALRESEEKVKVNDGPILHSVEAEKLYNPKEPMLILSACNKRYEPMMQALVRSVLENTPYQIKVDYLNTEGMDEQIARDYCANYRLQMFLENFSEKRNMLWLDADTLVRGDISQLDEWMEKHDCLAVHTPEMGKEGSVNHWLISTVGVSRHGKKFLDCWKREHDKIYEAWKPSIMTVQQSFVNALTVSKANVKDITYHYSDKNMKDDSPIWEAQGPRKTNEKWLEESKGYERAQI